MSRSAERRGHADEGFTLVEVVVSIGLVGLLVAMVLPGLVTGIRATQVARSATQEKSLALAELERMRNLPFHVAPEAGDFVDVLDRYFTDLRPPATAIACTDDGGLIPPTVAMTGYVAGAARCAWEPAGPFYRVVRTEASDPDLAGFVLVVDTQLVTSALPPAVVTPRAGWTTQETSHDTPPASQIGVTVTVFATGGAAREPLSSYTQISRTEQASTRVSASVDVTALETGTSLLVDTEVPVGASAGLLRLSTALTFASVTNAHLSGLSAGISTSDPAQGATTTAAAPPDGTAPTASAPQSALDASGCALLCWGPTRTTAATLATADGLPRAGSPTAPLGSSVSADGTRVLRLGSGTDPSYLPGLGLSGRLVDVTGPALGSATGTDCSVGAGGEAVRIGASGWLRTTDPGAPGGAAVEACATARAATTALLPTEFAPDGLVRVRLASAVARCRVSGSGHVASATYDYDATVEYWSASAGRYVEVARVRPGTAAALPDPADLPVVDGRSLDSWIDSWSAITPARVRAEGVGGRATVSVPGVVTLLTKPLRERAGTPVDVSTVALTLGSVACTAEDGR